MPEQHDDWAFDTRAVRAGRQWSRDSLAPVLFPSTTYEVASVDDHRRMAATPRTAHYYSLRQPVRAGVRAAVAALEGAEAALASASGMAALSGVVFGLCSAGDHIVAQRQLFSITSMLLTAHCPRFGIDVTFVDGTDTAVSAPPSVPGARRWCWSRRPPTRRSPSPTSRRWRPSPARSRWSTRRSPRRSCRPRWSSARTWCCTPPPGPGRAQRRPARGGGQARADRRPVGVAGGAGRPGVAVRRLERLQGIRTLGVRVRQQCATAQALAEHLAAHPGVVAGQLPGPRLASPARPGQAADAGRGHHAGRRGRRRARRPAGSARRPGWPASRCRSAAWRRW